mgnify:CR=1 FL=1
MDGLFQDRRERRRRHLLLYLDVLDEDTGKILGQLGDITPEGLLILAPGPLPLDSERTVRVKFPEVRHFGGPDLVVRVRPCWSGPDVNPEHSGTGFRFVEPDEKLLHQVRYLVERLGFTD